MAFGKITGSVIQNNTITESNLAFGISGQSAATSWATDTLKVNIIESDDSTAIQINDSINVSGNITTAGTVEMDRLSLSSNQTTVPPLQLTANSLQDGVGALRIDGSQADIFLNPSTATHTTVTFAVNNDQRLAFGMDNNSDFYITRRTSSTWYDDTFVIDRDTGELRYGYDVTVSGNFAFDSGVSVNTILDEDDMSSNSATALATQQSIKAYVDSQTGGSSSFTFVGDDSTGATIQSGDSIQFKGGTGVQVTVDDDSTKGFAVVNFTSTAAINLDGGNATTDYNLEAILLDGGGA